MATPNNPLSAFFWGPGGAAMTPAEIAKRRQIEDAILAQGVDTSPVGHWTQGLARVANAAGGAYRRHKLDGAEGESKSLGSAAFNKLMGALQGQSGATSSAIPMSDVAAEVAATAPSGGAVGGDMQQYRDAIASIESKGSGGYAAIGPTHDTLGRALGRYQVMEANIGPWSQEALGKPITADEFLASPELQDKIFDHKFGGYINEYGPEGASQAWFGGPGGVGKTGRKDVLGTSIGGYGQKFMNAIGNPEVASLNPEAAIEAVAPIEGSIPIEGASLADEVAEFRPTPEFAERYPYLNTGEAAPLADQQFDDRFGQTPLPVEQLTGRDAIAQALIEQKNAQMPAQAAIVDQTAALPATGQAAQSGGFMQAVNGTNTGGVFGLNPMQQQVAQASPATQGGDLLSDPAFLEAMSNPHLTDQQRAIAQAMVERQMQQRDAARRQQEEQSTWMQRQQYEEEQQARDPLRQAQIKAMQEKGQNLINAGDGRLYNPQSGEWIIAPSATGGEGKGFRFGGNSVEAQSLNGLMDAGQLTPDQAQQLGAGKTITGPNGEIIFMTPQGVFGSTAEGQTQKLSGGTPTGDAGNVDKGARQGNITLTEPKVTVDERKAMGFADRMDASGKLLNQHEQAGLGVKDQFVRGNDWIPDFAENWLVSEDFQKFDQSRRDFINAQLRRESGAVISPEEFDNANKQYFPQPGDTKEVVEQKRANRDIVIKSMARDSGPTYGGGKADPLADARKAIAAGANRDAVMERLRDNGIDPGGL